jgi:hypothetical protein
VDEIIEGPNDLARETNEKTLPSYPAAPLSFQASSIID